MVRKKYVLQLRTSDTVTRGWYGMFCAIHYNNVIMSAMASQITSLTMVFSTIYWDADQWKYHSSASLAFVRGIHWWPMNYSHKGPVTRKMFQFDDVIMESQQQEHVDEKWIECTIANRKLASSGASIIKWSNFNPSLVKCGMKLLILSQTLPVQLLNFGNPTLYNWRNYLSL